MILPLPHLLPMTINGFKMCIRDRLLTLLCVSLIGMRELYNAMGVHKSGMDLLELAGYLGAVLYYGTCLLYTS